MVTSSKTPRKDSKIAFTPRTSSLVKYVYMTLKFLSLMRKKPSEVTVTILKVTGVLGK